MKTYYSLQCGTPQRSFVKSLAEPLFVLGWVAAMCAAVWVTKGVAAERQSAASPINRLVATR